MIEIRNNIWPLISLLLSFCNWKAIIFQLKSYYFSINECTIPLNRMESTSSSHKIEKYVLTAIYRCIAFKTHVRIPSVQIQSTCWILNLSLSEIFIGFLASPHDRIYWVFSYLVCYKIQEFSSKLAHAKSKPKEKGQSTSLLDTFAWNFHKIV